MQGSSHMIVQAWTECTLMIVRVRVRIRNITICIQRNVNLFAFLIHARQKYMTSYIPRRHGPYHVWSDPFSPHAWKGAGHETNFVLDLLIWHAHGTITYCCACNLHVHSCGYSQQCCCVTNLQHVDYVALLCHYYFFNSAINLIALRVLHQWHSLYWVVQLVYGICGEMKL